MALAGRSSRRGGAGIRWLAIGVVITLLVLLIDASLHSRSVTTAEDLAAGTWIDRVLPVIATSTAEGEQLQQLWANGLHLSGPTISSQLEQLTAGSASAYQAVIKLRPPDILAGQSGLLEASLLSRSEATAALQSAFSPVLASSSSGSSAANQQNAIAAIHTAGTDLAVGDQAYELLVRTMPGSVGVQMPPSKWLTNSSPYEPQTAQIFLTSLQNAVVPTPVHQLKIYSVTTSPAAVSIHGTTKILPDESTMDVTVVVADVGNQPENNLTVTAAIQPATAGSSSVRDFVNLVPGQAYTIAGMGPLNPPQGTPFDLVITVTPPAGSATTSTGQTIGLFMPAPPPSTTTTTTKPASPPTT
jgi:hypothetical protein